MAFVNATNRPTVDLSEKGVEGNTPNHLDIKVCFTKPVWFGLFVTFNGCFLEMATGYNKFKQINETLLEFIV